MNQDTVELSFFSDAVIKRWYLPLGLALVGLLIGLQFQPEPGPTLYEAESRLLIRPVTDSVLDSNLRVDQIINSDTEAQLAGSEVVAREALAALAEEAPRELSLDELTERVDVTVRPDSQIVVIRYRDEDPDVAGAVTDAMASAYLSARTEPALVERDSQAGRLASQISELTRDLTSANITIATADAEASARASLETRIARLEEVVAVDSLRGEQAEVVGDPIGELRAELAALEESVDPASLAAAVTRVELVTGQIADLREELIGLSTVEINGGEVIQQAGIGEPVAATNVLLYPAIGALAGMMLGLAGAVLVQRSVATRAARGAPSIRDATIPVNEQLVAVDTPATPAATPDRRRAPEPAMAGAPTMSSWGVVPTATAPAVDIVEQEPTLRAVDEPRRRTDDTIALFDQDSAKADPDLGAVPHFASPAASPTPAETAVPGDSVSRNDIDLQPSTAAVAPPVAPPVSGVLDPGVASAAVRSAPSADNSVAALADVPKIPRSAQEPIVMTAPSSEPAIALRRVARLVQNTTSDIETPVILVTSPKPHEGRTTVAANIAAALRQDGLSVVLITDAHTRVIAPGVHVLPPGMQLGPEHEFPPTDRFRELMVEARDLVDIVIIDGPPMLSGEDALRLSTVAHASVIVAVSGRTSAHDVATTKLLLESSESDVLGLVTTARPSWLVRRLTDRTIGNGPSPPASTQGKSDLPGDPRTTTASSPLP